MKRPTLRKGFPSCQGLSLEGGRWLRSPSFHDIRQMVHPNQTRFHPNPRCISPGYYEERNRRPREESALPFGGSGEGFRVSRRPIPKLCRGAWRLPPLFRRRKVQKLNAGQFPSPAISAECKFPMDHGSRFVSGLPGSTRLSARDDRLHPAQERSAQGTGRGPTHPLIAPTELAWPPSGCLTIIVVQHSPQPLAALNRSTVRGT